MPPIHPIGTAYRKGKNNSVTPEDGDVGSPWAIGCSRRADTRLFIPSSARWPTSTTWSTAAQCEWDGSRAGYCLPVLARSSLGDGASGVVHASAPTAPSSTRRTRRRSIRISIPLNFESATGADFGMRCTASSSSGSDRGVRVFRVDNPHTKALPFWEWCIAEMLKDAPDVIFLAEAFTRPHVMYSLAKGRLHAELHLLHLAHHQSRIAGVLRRDHNAAGQRSFPPQRLAEYSGHSARAVPGRGPGAPGYVSAACHSRCHAELRTTESMDRLMSCWKAGRQSRRPERPPAKSISTARSTRFVPGTATTRTPSRRSSPSSTRFARRTRHCRETRTWSFTPSPAHTCWPIRRPTRTRIQARPTPSSPWSTSIRPGRAQRLAGP